MKTDATETTSQTTAEHLRRALADGLRRRGTVRTDRVDTAIRAVPRHLFLPGVTVTEAYADEPVYTKLTPDGVTKISAASQPTIVAMMLEQLGVEPGQRILEIGAGTGYNAGLLAHLAGPDGTVVTIDVDDDIVDGARSGLTAAGYDNARVILGDGALGYPDDAPYDRVTATVGAFDLPPAWLEQLAPHGRLVVPLRLRGSVSRAIAFERADGHWHSRSSEMCSFMPLRDGAANDPQRVVALTPDGAVTFQAHQEQAVDAAALADVLTQPRSEAWTGVLFAGPESQEWLYLWLACTLEGSLSRMEVHRSAIDSGLVKPAFGWGTMATTSKSNLAYLTLRPIGTADARRYEIGVIGHGPGGDELTNRVASEIRTWDQDHRSQTVHVEIQPGATRPQITGQFIFKTPHNRLAITWL